MNVIVEIPDDLAARLAADGVDLRRRALEALILEQLRDGRLTDEEASHVLGLELPEDVRRLMRRHASSPAILGPVPGVPVDEAVERMLEARRRNLLPDGVSIRDLLDDGRA